MWLFVSELLKCLHFHEFNIAVCVLFFPITFSINCQQKDAARNLIALSVCLGVGYKLNHPALTPLFHDSSCIASHLKQEFSLSPKLFTIGKDSCMLLFGGFGSKPGLKKLQSLVHDLIYLCKFI